MQISRTFVLIFILIHVFHILFLDFTRSFYLNPGDFNLASLITSIFLHSPNHLFHLIFNCYALFMFGSLLERNIGRENFFYLFLLSGIAGNLSYLFMSWSNITPPIPAIGASGAIFGVLGSVAILLPHLKVFMFFIPIPISIRTVVIFWAFLDFINMFNAGSGIGHAAHLGGLFFGLIFTKYLMRKRHYF